MRRLSPSEVLERSEYRPGQLEPEFYLWELADLDLDDASAIAEFVSMFGPLTSKNMGRKFRAAESVFGMQRDLIGKKKGFDAQDVLPLEEFRFAAGRFAMSRGPCSPTPACLAPRTWSAHGRPGRLSSRGRRGGPPAMAWAVGVLDSGLTPSRRVSRSLRPEMTPRPAVPPARELYNAVCLEIFNDVAGGSTFRTCEKCGRAFVRQRGRAVYGQHKREANLRYCSKRCANAAAQAAHRAKVAKAKGREG